MTRFLFRLPLLALFGGALFVLTACDSGGNNNDNDQPSLNNAFSLTVTDSTGATSTLKGYSYFATGRTENGEEGFVLYFLDDENFSQNTASNGLFGLAILNAGRPSIGNYLASDDDASFDSGSTFAMVLYENLNAQDGTIYTVTDGDINITRSEANRMDGTLNLTATAFTFAEGETERTATIKGDFRSPGVDAFFGMGFLQP